MRGRILKLFKDKRRLLISLTLFFLCLPIFSFFMGQTVSAAPDKIRSEYLFYHEEAAEVAINDGVLRQQFTHSGKLYSIGVFVWVDDPSEAVTCRITDSNSKVLAVETKDLSEFSQSGMVRFEFSPPLLAPDGVFVMELEVSPKAGVLIKTGGGAPEGWLLVNGGGTADSAVVLVAGVDELGGFILNFYWVFAVFLSASVASMYFLSSGKKLSLHLLFAVAATLLGLLYCFILPPYSSPDEQFHINETFTLSSEWLDRMPDEGIKGNMNVKRAGDSNAVVEELFTTAFSYKEIANGLVSASADPGIGVFSGERVGGYKLLFWPAALGVTLARLLGLGFIPALFFGRFANLALYILLSTLSVKYAPLKKSAFALVGLLPMTMHLAASFNRDMLTIGLYMLITSYCLNLILEKAAVTPKDLAVVLVASALALPAKVVYAPLLLLILLIPGDKLEIREKKVDPKFVKFAKLAVVGIGLTFFIVTALPYIRSALKPPKDASAAGHPDEIVYKLPYILANLKDTLWLVINTVFTHSAFYLSTLVGGKLGYFNIDVSWFFVLVFYLLLAASSLPERDASVQPSKKHRLFGVAFAGISSLLVVYACINWTPTYFLTIYGIQGRYFLPQLPLFLVLAGGSRVIEKTKNIDRPLLFLTFTFSAFTLLNAFLVILAR